MPFPIGEVRAEFPALDRAGDFIFFDNAAGAQAPKAVLDAVADHLLMRNVQRGGRYRQSLEVDATIARARQSVATLLNANGPEEVCFGMNATSFIRLVSLALGQKLGSRREIIVTELDHEANIATWLALEAQGAEIRFWPMRDDGHLHLEDLAKLLTERTRIVACTMASNALGTLVDIPRVARLTHDAGAQLFVDAVHYAPHGALDVRALGCDFLVCSGYKIFGPHMGFLWGRQELLNALPVFREDFLPDVAPVKFEVGTGVYENVAGMDAAIGYLEKLGRKLGADGSKRWAVVRAMDAIQEYEMELSRAFLSAVAATGRVTVYGETDPKCRTPTFCFNVEGVAPAIVAARLAEQGIAVRDGHMYAPRVIRRMGLAVETGAVRASLVHYNTVEEIRRFVTALGSSGL